jgi:hypothetical protein
MSGRSQSVIVATLLVLAAVGILAAVTAERASAQLPSICDQYPALPPCQVPDDEGEGPDRPLGQQGPDGLPGDGDQDDDGIPDVGAGIPGAGGPTAGLPGGAAGGQLPFTGYPLSPLLLLLLILLLIGLTIRAYLAIRDRIRARELGPPGPA